jgi:AI-2 transport protein TqsA
VSEVIKAKKKVFKLSSSKQTKKTPQELSPLQKISYIALIFLAIIALLFVLKTFQSFLRPFFFAIILTLLITPLLRFTKKKEIPMFIPILAIAAGIFLIIAIIYAIVGTNATAFATVAQNSPLLKQNVIETLPNLQIFGLNIPISSFIETSEINRTINSMLRQLFNSVGAFFSELLLAIIFMIFLIPSHDKTLKNISQNLSRKNKTNLYEAVKNIEQNIFIYLREKTIISFGTALASLIVMAMFNVPFLLTYALIIFLLNYIPTLGSIIAVSIVLGAFWLTNGFSSTLIILGLLLTGIQILFGNIIEPKIAGQSLKLSPIIILLSLFLWFWVWGFMGMIIAVPIASIVKIILESFESTKHIAAMME